VRRRAAADAQILRRRTTTCLARDYKYDRIKTFSPGSSGGEDGWFQRPRLSSPDFTGPLERGRRRKDILFLQDEGDLWIPIPDICIEQSGFNRKQVFELGLGRSAQHGFLGRESFTLPKHVGVDIKKRNSPASNLSFQTKRVPDR